MKHPVVGWDKKAANILSLLHFAEVLEVLQKQQAERREAEVLTGRNRSGNVSSRYRKKGLSTLEIWYIDSKVVINTVVRRAAGNWLGKI